MVLLDLKDSLNLYQITSGNNINSKRLYKNKYENIVYKNYDNSQIKIDVNNILGPKILDIIRVVKFQKGQKA